MSIRIVSTLVPLVAAAGLASAQQFNPTSHDYFPESSLPTSVHCFAGTGGGAKNMAKEDCIHGVSFWSDLDIPYAPHAHVFDFDATGFYLGGPIASVRFYCEGYFSGANNINPLPTDGDQYELYALYEAKIQVLDQVTLNWVDLAPTFLDPVQVNLDGSTVWDTDAFVYADLWTAPVPTAGAYAGPIDQTLPSPGAIVATNGNVRIRIQWCGRIPGNGYDANLVMDEVFMEFVEGTSTSRLYPVLVSQDDQASMYTTKGGDGVANLTANDGVYNVSWFQNNVVLYGNGPNGPYELGDVFTFDISSLGLIGSQIKDLRFYAKAFLAGNQSTSNSVRVSPSAPPASFLSDEADELGYIRSCVWEVYDHNGGTWKELGAWLVPDKRATIVTPGQGTLWDGTPHGGQWSQPGPVAGEYAGPIDLQAGAVFTNNHLSTTGELKIRLRWIYDAPHSTGEEDTAHFFDHVFVEVNQMGGHSTPTWPSWCPGTRGFARLSTSGGVARPGNSGLTLGIQNGTPGAFTTLVVGLSNTSLNPGLPNSLPYDLSPLGYGDCFLAVSVNSQVGFPLGPAGGITVPAAIPNNPLFSAGSVYLQAYFVDPLLPTQVAFTNGLVLQLQP